MTVTELTDICHRSDVTELTVTELTRHRYGLSPIRLAPDKSGNEALTTALTNRHEVINNTNIQSNNTE